MKIVLLNLLDSMMSGVPPFGNWWMGWCFTTSFWAEKKQVTFFRFPARCAAVRAAGIKL